MTFATTFFACSDDDDKEPAKPKVVNQYIYDGSTRAINTAVFENDIEENGGGYTLWFASGDLDREAAWKEYVGIQVPKERLGTKFELTEEKPYGWGWWIEFNDDDEKVRYSGFGGKNRMNNVKSGTMSVSITGEDNFDVELDIVLTDDKTLKLSYSGKMVDWDAGDVVSRKAEHPVDTESPNQ